MENISDRILIEKYLQGDEKSLEELIGRYLPLIYNFSKRYAGNPDNASDITQEVFVKVWKNIKKFDTSKDFKAWIFSIAKNTALDWFKKKNAIPFSLLKEHHEDENFEANIVDVDQAAMVDRFYQESLYKNLSAATLKLPPKYSSLINLYHNKDLNFREIAATLNESINTVKSRYRRGLILLRKSLF